MELIMSSEFAKKIRFKLKKIERPIYIRNMNGTFNKEELIEYIVEINIYYQRYIERIEINVVKNKRSRLNIFLFSFLNFILFLIYFLILFLELGLRLE